MPAAAPGLEQMAYARANDNSMSSMAGLPLQSTGVELPQAERFVYLGNTLARQALEEDVDAVPPAISAETASSAAVGGPPTVALERTNAAGQRVLVTSRDEEYALMALVAIQNAVAAFQAQQPEVMDDRTKHMLLLMLEQNVVFPLMMETKTDFAAAAEEFQTPAGFVWMLT